VKKTLFAATYALYLIFGLLQIVATADAIQRLTRLTRLTSWLAALVVGWVPLVGTTLGIYGAHADWQWSLRASCALVFRHARVVFGRSHRVASVPRGRN
jgi:hypothetical protein